MHHDRRKVYLKLELFTSCTLSTNLLSLNLHHAKQSQARGYVDASGRETSARHTHQNSRFVSKLLPARWPTVAAAAEQLDGG